MSAAWQPRGPEAARTYWIRRGIVLGAVVLVLALLVWGVTALAGGRKDTVSPAVPASTAPQTPVDTSAAASSPTPSAPASPATSPSASSTSTSSGSAAAKPTAGSSSSASQKPTPHSGEIGCDPATVKLAVKGTSPVKSGSSTGLTVTASDQDGGCTLDLTKNPLELRIYSGSDRIWSTKDCAKWAPAGSVKLPAKGTWTWTSSWSTKRSSSDCKLSDEYLRPGTYVATAVISGGAPAQYVMNLVG